MTKLNETMEEVAKHLLIIIEIWGPYRFVERDSNVHKLLFFSDDAAARG